MNYLSRISHRILFFGKFWPVFTLEAGYHFEEYRSFVALRRRDSHIKESQTGHLLWSPEWPARTLLVTITSELVIASSLSSSLKIGLALQDPPPHRLQHTRVSHIQGGRGTLAGEGTGTPPHCTFTAKAQQCFEENTSTEMSLKSQREKPVINNRWLSVVHLLGKLYHFPVWGLGNLRHRGGEVVCQGALAVTLLFLIY